MFVRHSSFNESISTTITNSQSFTSLQDLSAIIQEKEFECYTEVKLDLKLLKIVFLLKLFSLKIAKTESKKIYDRIINYRIPVSHFASSSKNVYCTLNCSDVRHFAHIDYRECCYKDKCPTTYKIVKCSNLNIYRLFQKFAHNHPLLDGYNNLIGIDHYFKMKINDYLTKNITAPKRIQGDLTVMYRNLRLNDNDQQVDYNTGVGDIIPIPTYEQVKSYVNTNKTSFQV